MSSYLERTRAALRTWLGGQPQAQEPPSVAATPIGDNLAVAADGTVTFADPDRAATDPTTWLDLFDAALNRDAPISGPALDLLRAVADRLSPDSLLWGAAARSRFLDLLRPRPGLAARLTELRDGGILGALFPEFFASSVDAHSLRAIQNLERLLVESDLSGTRFGTMLRELNAPELVVLALVFHDTGTSKDHDPARAAAAAQAPLDRLQLSGDHRHVVEFLIESQSQMAQFALRRDTNDPEVIGRFATFLTAASQYNPLSTEEHLKMLCLLTVADVGASGRESLTSWKAELLWRLFVDTYNHLTMAYGDEVIDRDAAARTALHHNRPADITEAELTRFLEGLPRRYLTLFDPASIYQHVRLWRNIGADDVHTFLTRKGEFWELTVVTLDKPFLFANICGVLASIGADILRGQALTSLAGLVLDVFEFSDDAHAVDAKRLDRLLGDVVAGRVDIAAQLAEQHQRSADTAAPLLYFDNEYSQRYTVLEVVTGNAPGLLHRVSRALSTAGCEVDLVLINTEGEKAIDVFHLRLNGEKLTDSDQLALTELLERSVRGSA